MIGICSTNSVLMFFYIYCVYLQFSASCFVNSWHLHPFVLLNRLTEYYQTSRKEVVCRILVAMVAKVNTCFFLKPRVRFSNNVNNMILMWRSSTWPMAARDGGRFQKCISIFWKKCSCSKLDFKMAFLLFIFLQATLAK